MTLKNYYVYNINLQVTESITFRIKLTYFLDIMCFDCGQLLFPEMEIAIHIEAV